jgi:hypothetical protein
VPVATQPRSQLPGVRAVDEQERVMSRQMERQDKLARFRGATALLLDVLGEDDEAEGVLDEVAGGGRASRCSRERR